jgi:hypothetical protein
MSSRSSHTYYDPSGIDCIVQIGKRRAEKKEKRANPVNCHHIHIIKATIDKRITDYETETRMLYYIYLLYGLQIKENWSI